LILKHFFADYGFGILIVSYSLFPLMGRYQPEGGHG